MHNKIIKTFSFDENTYGLFKIYRWIYNKEYKMYS